MEGWLIKRAMKSGRNWKKRYFVLDAGKREQNYFKKPGGQLRGTLVLGPNSVARNSNIKPHAFEVSSSIQFCVGTSNYILPRMFCWIDFSCPPFLLQVHTAQAALYTYAPSEVERDRWVQTLTRVILQLNNA